MTDKILKATHGAPDRPLRIGDIQIPCYVLENGARVLVRSSVVTALGMSIGSSSSVTNDRLLNFALGKSLSPFFSEDLVNMMKEPFRFKTTKGTYALGYDATILADICEAVLAARKAGALLQRQSHIADQCEILMRGFARVGIISLVDEATGYQEVRDRLALQKILDKFISKELSTWAKRFPDEFYEQMFRLRGWDKPATLKRPSVVGILTNDIVYDRLAPGVLQELKNVTPKNEKGKPKHKLHQHLTTDVGHPKLAEHLSNVITLMKASSSWTSFYRLIQRALPRYGNTLELPFPDDMDD
jgi:hypothetical protein